MTTPLPYRAAALHGAGACAIVGAVALLWQWTAGGRDTSLALATVAAIGVLAWTGAALVAGLRPTAANDNQPLHPASLVWAPIADRPEPRPSR